MTEMYFLYTISHFKGMPDVPHGIIYKYIKIILDTHFVCHILIASTVKHICLFFLQICNVMFHPMSTVFNCLCGFDFIKTVVYHRVPYRSYFII